VFRGGPTGLERSWPGSKSGLNAVSGWLHPSDVLPSLPRRGWPTGRSPRPCSSPQRPSRPGISQVGHPQPCRIALHISELRG